MHRRPDCADHADGRVVELDDHVIVQCLRVLERIGKASHRAAEDVVPLQSLDPVTGGAFG